MNNIAQNNIYNIPFVNGYALQEYLSAEDGLIEAKKANYTHWYIDGSLIENLPETWNLHRISELQDKMQTHKMKAFWHGNYKVPLASDVFNLRIAAIEYTKKEIDLASHFNAPIIIHGGAIVEPRLINKAKISALNNYLDSIKILVDYAKDKNVDIYLENLSNYKDYKPFHYIFTTLDEFEYILNQIPNVKFFLDIGHANICDGDPIQIIQKYHNRIAAMSFSNNNGKNDQHLRISNGTIDYHKIISTILNYRWKGIIAFETRGVTPQQSINDLFNLYNEVINNSAVSLGGAA